MDDESNILSQVLLLTTTDDSSFVQVEEEQLQQQQQLLLLQQKFMERYALLVLFYSTNGNSWFRSNEWFTNLDVCRWYGIICDYVNSPTTTTSTSAVAATATNASTTRTTNDVDVANQLLFVTSLILNENNLDGELPPDIGILRHLTSIHMNGIGDSNATNRNFDQTFISINSLLFGTPCKT